MGQASVAARNQRQGTCFRQICLQIEPLGETLKSTVTVEKGRITVSKSTLSGGTTRESTNA